MPVLCEIDKFVLDFKRLNEEKIEKQMINRDKYIHILEHMALKWGGWAYVF